ncbi:MAG: Holliday junction branch migration protein RuvA [Bacteriovoracaceae bacterium]|nr:Holliday junction branch migration protein RuvA [Bacteriovoracaceae bacterium]
MIGYIQGEVIFSDGSEAVILSSSGVGYQIYFNTVLPEGEQIALYISHIIKEASEELYGFESLRDKKLFEMLIQVKGVGPKTAYTLMKTIKSQQICDAISFDNKKALTKAPGIGNKAAAQIILDLGTKIHKVKMYSSRYTTSSTKAPIEVTHYKASVDTQDVMDETIMACKELGLKEDVVVELAQQILSNNSITKAEQLVHLVLKQI